MKRITFPLFLFWGSILIAQVATPDSSTLPSVKGQRDVDRNVSSIDAGERSGNIKNRITLVAGAHVLGYAGTLLVLSEAWYKDFPRTSFHTFNDSREWLQVDKVGHAWTSYTIAKYSADSWAWAGLRHRPAAILGGLSSIAYQTIIEYLDAHSPEWGWSWADVGANFAGSALYVGQEMVWQRQKMGVKFSSHRVNYSADLVGRADSLYGASFAERILKDYNGQTYWLSGNLQELTGMDNVPGWLNVAVGYGAKGLFGGFSNIGYSKQGEIIFSRPEIKRQRQWYLSPDIDLTKIKTQKKGLKIAFYLLNMIKLPAPALELSGGKLKAHLLHF